jgi:hypothetical protein
MERLAENTDQFDRLRIWYDEASGFIPHAAKSDVPVDRSADGTLRRGLCS